MATDPGFVTYYLNELNHLRIAGTEFSRSHPDLAGGLDFASSETDDPQIARLIESFAFLAARLQRQYDAQFPEVPTALLEALYPQLVAPVPSMAVAHFAVSPKQQRAIEGVKVPRQTGLFATTAGGAECRFMTTSTLQLWPIEISGVWLKPASELALLDDRSDVHSCLRVRLKCLGERNFADLAPESLRLYLDGDRNARYRLYELLTHHRIEIRIAPKDGEKASAAPPLPGLSLRQAGLEPEDAMLPYPDTAHHGYRLLQEYFNFPDKFLFLDLVGLKPGMLGDAQEVDLLFFLNIDPEEPLQLDRRSMRLNCVPIVNLFPQTSEPIRLDHLSTEYLLEPDLRAADVTEVHSVLRVTRSAGATGTRKSEVISPFFSPDPDVEGEGEGALRWMARRAPISNPALTGTEMLLSFVDPKMDPAAAAEDVLFAQTLCTNRELPRHITLTTRLQIELDLPSEDVRCLAKPTSPAYPPLGGENLWRLVSQLTLNKWSLEGPSRLDALKQLLLLYSGGDADARKRRQIDGIYAIVTRPIVRRLGTAHWRGFVRGTEIVVSFNEDQFVGNSALLLGSVLDRFFALYAGVNSFTELVVRRAHHNEDWKRWPARAGDQPIL
jgi:type VI secretion system protein ImpG